MVTDVIDLSFRDGYIPNALRSGRDGGADGVYPHRMFGIAGPWKVAIATRRILAALKTKVKKENRAARGRYKGLLFVTSYDATPTDVLALRKLAKKGLRGGIVWARARLTRYVQRHRWLAAQHFGQQLISGFAPVTDAVEQDRAGQDDIALIGRTNEISQFTAFLTNKDRILLIDGPGGAGKSRFLRELATLAHLSRPRRSTWLRRPGQGSIEDSLNSGLPLATPILLILDDAGRALDDLRQLSRVATGAAAGIDVKLIVAVRSADLTLVSDTLEGARGQTQLLSVSELDQKDLVDLIKADWNGATAEAATWLAERLGKNLFLLRAAVQLLKDGSPLRTLVDRQHVRDLVAKRLLDEGNKRLTELGSARPTAEVLIDLALNVPVPAEMLSQPEIALQAARFLRQVGGTIRFRSDVEGDVLLGYLLERPAAQAYVRAKLEADPRQLLARIRNLSAAGSGTAAALIQGTCRNWLEKWRALDPETQWQILEALPFCVNAAAKEVVSICAQAISTMELSTDNIGPIVLALARQSPCLALKACDDIGYHKLREGMYANYKIVGLGDRIANLRRVSRAMIDEICDLLEHWISDTLTESAQSRAALIEAVSKTLLSLVVRIEDSSPAGYQFGEMPLTPTPNIVAMRGRVIGLMESLLRHPNRRMRKAGARLLHFHARSEGGMTSSAEMLPLLEQEFSRVARILLERLQNEPDPEIQNDIRSDVFFRWATHRPGHAAAGDMLRHSVAVEVSAFSLLVDPWNWFYSFEELAASAPSQGRWHWWIHEGKKRREQDVDRLIDDLAREHTTREGVSALIERLPGGERLLALVEAWHRRNPALFDAIARRAGSERIGRLVGKALARRAREQNPALSIDDIRRALSDGDLDLVAEIAARMGTADEGVRATVAGLLIEDDRIAMRAIGLSLLGRPGLESLAGPLKRRAIRDGDWSTQLDVLYELTSAGTENGAVDDRTLLHSLIRDRLADSARAGARWNTHGQWYAEQLLESVLPADPMSRLSFVADLLPSTAATVQHLCRLCLSRLLATETDASLVVKRGCEWIRAKKIADVEALGMLLQDPDSGFVSVPKSVAVSLLGADTPEEQQAGVLLLSHFEDDSEAIAKLADLAASPGPVQSTAKEMLSQVDMRGVFTRSLGQPSSRRVALNAVLSEARQMVSSAAARRLIDDLISSGDAMLAAERRLDEEDADPR